MTYGGEMSQKTKSVLVLDEFGGTCVMLTPFIILPVALDAQIPASGKHTAVLHDVTFLRSATFLTFAPVSQVLDVLHFLKWGAFSLLSPVPLQVLLSVAKTHCLAFCLDKLLLKWHSLFSHPFSSLVWVGQFFVFL